METEPTITPGPGKNDRDLQPGQKVGEYVIDAKIGEGGFGTVFKASHPLIGKVAAIKLLNRQYSADPEMVSRFVAEARAVNQIRHRNIIDIFAFGQIEDGRSYYVMEYLDGQPLDEYLEHGGAIPLGEAIPILRAVARALDAAHAKGIAHRDLKPENIFLARESDGSVFPKLLDFGIAKLLDKAGAGTAMHKTRTGAPIGTPYYMSPEQCRGRDVDHRTDIYAFGVVAYKLLTGEVPFDGEDYMDILLKQIGEEPVPPSERSRPSPDGSGGTGLPRAVDDAIAWMMKKDPAQRPPNLITAMRALEDAAQAAGVQFVPDQPTGLHAAQRTPSAMRSIPKTPSAGSLAGAATVDAARLSDIVDAAGPAITPAPGELPGKKGPLLWIVALVGAVAVGAIVFFVVRGQKTEEAPPPPPEPVAKPAVAPDAALPETPDVAAPRLIKITITGAPDGTEVYGPRGLLGVAPGDVQLDRGDQEVVLTFKADGYLAASQTVMADQDRTIEVTLEKKVVETADRDKDRDRGKGKSGGKSDGGKSNGGKSDGGKSGKGGKGGRDTLEDPFATPK